MKTLVLVRHAKSSWAEPAHPDRDRPLNERGERDVAMMGKRLAQRHAKPDLILTSPAVRALATAEQLAQALGVKHKHLVVIEGLYAAPAAELLEQIQRLGNGPAHVMLVAHNPGLTDLAHRLAREITHMPTCAIAEFRFEQTSWADLGKARPTHVAFDYPKNV